MRSDLEVFAHGLSMMRARLTEYREQCAKAVSDYVQDSRDSTANLAKLTIDKLLVEVIDVLITSSDPRHARQVMLDAIRNEKMPVAERDKKLIDTAIDEALRKAALACEQQGHAPHSLPSDLVVTEAAVVRTCVQAIHAIVAQPETQARLREKILRIANEK